MREHPRYLYQCPGCWSYGLWAIPVGGGRSKTDEGWIECECGERMTRIDLRRSERASAGADPEPRPYITSEDMWDAWTESQPQHPDGRHMIRLAEAVNRRIHVEARAQGGPSLDVLDGASRGKRCPATHDVAGWCSRDEGHPGAHESRHPRGPGLGAWWNERYPRAARLGVAPEPPE